MGGGKEIAIGIGRVGDGIDDREVANSYKVCFKIFKKFILKIKVCFKIFKKFILKIKVL